MSERLQGRLMGGLVVALIAVAVGMLVTGRSTGENRATQLEQRLRCPVCKSVSIAESPSATAASQRRIVESQVAQGRTDEEIVDYFTARYGEWIVLDAPPKGDTLPLWLIVVAGAAVGVAVLLSGPGRRRRSAPELGAADRAEVEAALTSYLSRDAEDDEP